MKQKFSTLSPRLICHRNGIIPNTWPCTARPSTTANCMSRHNTMTHAFALPMVLWAIAFLAGLLLLTVKTVNNWVEEESHAERAFRARQMALSGVAMGMNTNIKPGDPLLVKGDPTSKEGESFVVQLNNETAFINPNIWLAKSDRIIFQRLFTAWEVSEKDQEAAIDGLYDWQSPTTLRSAHGAKSGDYEAIGLDGYPPNAPFVNAQEMAMVIGFAPIMKAKPQWRKYFSTFNPGKINIMFCSPDMLVDVVGLTPEQVETFIKLADQPDATSGKRVPFNSIDDAIKLIGPNQLQQSILKNYFDITGNVRRIDSTGRCYGITHHIIVVMAVGGSNNMLSWQEQ